MKSFSVGLLPDGLNWQMTPYGLLNARSMFYSIPSTKTPAGRLQGFLDQSTAKT
jgi:hypothetical protein